MPLLRITALNPSAQTAITQALTGIAGRPGDNYGGKAKAPLRSPRQWAKPSIAKKKKRGRK